jgi:hypothetical protein
MGTFQRAYPSEQEEEEEEEYEEGFLPNDYNAERLLRDAPGPQIFQFMTLLVGRY